MCSLEQRRKPPKSSRVPEGLYLWQTTSPMWGTEPADQQVHLIRTQKTWSCLPASDTPCMCFISGQMECTEDGKWFTHQNETLVPHCNHLTVENYCKTNCFYASSRFHSQKVKHQKAAEWMTLTNAVNPSGVKQPVVCWRVGDGGGGGRGWKQTAERDGFSPEPEQLRPLAEGTSGTLHFDQERKYQGVP